MAKKLTETERHALDCLRVIEEQTSRIEALIHYLWHGNMDEYPFLDLPEMSEKEIIVRSLTKRKIT